MQINVSILLEEGEEAPGTPDEIASEVLLAVAGDEESGYCTVSVMPPPPSPGTAGTPPEPPLPPSQEE